MGAIQHELQNQSNQAELQQAQDLAAAQGQGGEGGGGGGEGGGAGGSGIVEKLRNSRMGQMFSARRGGRTQNVGGEGFAPPLGGSSPNEADPGNTREGATQTDRQGIGLARSQ